jgi:type IV secretory pathway VirB2 component (pilin)
MQLTAEVAHETSHEIHSSPDRSAARGRFCSFCSRVCSPVFAQANSPWENAVNVLQQAFTSTIARGLSLVAIVVSGLTFALGEGGSKRVLAGVLFGVGMA